MSNKRILIVGAGVAGQDVLGEIKKSPRLNLVPVGFIDDDVKKQGKKISSLKVLGGRRELKGLIKKKKIDEVIIAIPSAHGLIIEDVVKRCVAAKIKFRIVPRVREIIEGRAEIKRVREVRVEDLLGRPVVKTNVLKVAKFLQGKKILITGAAGSIGSELSRQVASYKPKQIVFYDWWENGLFDLGIEFEEHFPKVKTVKVIGSIQDKERVNKTFNKFKPEIVFHAAAYKHVPLMEESPSEAIKNNVFGTEVLATAAKKNKAEKFIFISTDKAVKPKSVMGGSKLIAEYLLSSFNKRGKTNYLTVRFGNVLESFGSVIPLFKKQIREGGPVTITDRRMVRYFMTISEAAHLILQAAQMGRGGEIFLLDMGEPVKIVDLAENLIRLSGFIPGKEIKIKFIGKRVGEKIREELLTKSERVRATKERKIFRTVNLGVYKPAVKKTLVKLRKLVKQGDERGILKELGRLIPTMKMGNHLGNKSG